MKISIFLLKIATAIDCHSCVSEVRLQNDAHADDISFTDDCFDPKSSTIVKTCNECYELLYAYHVTVTGNKQPEDNKMSTIWRMERGCVYTDDNGIEFPSGGQEIGVGSGYYDMAIQNTYGNLKGRYKRCVNKAKCNEEPHSTIVVQQEFSINKINTLSCYQCKSEEKATDLDSCYTIAGLSPVSCPSVNHTTCYETLARYEGPSSDLVYVERGCSKENLPVQNITSYGLIPGENYSTKTVFCDTNGCNKNREDEFSTASAKILIASLFMILLQILILN